VLAAALGARSADPEDLCRVYGIGESQEIRSRWLRLVQIGNTRFIGRPAHDAKDNSPLHLGLRARTEQHV
jgi:hypothetical protein